MRVECPNVTSESGPLACICLKVLPEVNLEQWKYGGEANVNRQKVDTWVFKSEPDQGYGHYVSNYTLSVSKVSSLSLTSRAS